MPFVPTILPALDALRAIGGKLGLRVFSVVVRRRTWTGSRPGVGTKTDVDTALTVQSADGSLQPARVRQVSRSEVFSSGGQYAARDLRVGPLTPAFAASLFLPGAGFDDTTINPAPTALATEIIWILKGVPDGSHGIPAGGIVCELRGQESTALHYVAVLRSTGRQPT